MNVLSRSVLSALACHLKGRIDDGVVSLMPVYERVLGQLAAFDLTEAEGARVRSRVKWAEEGETSSRFFLRLEKKRGTESWISAMRVSNGVVVTDVEGICESWASFYQDLFTACPVDLGVQSDLLDHLSLSLSPDEAALCDGAVLPNEAHDALSWLRESSQVLMVCQRNFMLLSGICLARILSMFSILPWRLARVACLSIYLCFLSDFSLGAGAVFSNINGVPMAVSVRLLVTLFICLSCGFEYVSLGRLCWLYCGRVLLLERVCLPSLCSPSVAFLGCTVVFLGSELVLLECGRLPSRCSRRSPLLVTLLFFLRSV